MTEQLNRTELKALQTQMNKTQCLLSWQEQWLWMMLVMLVMVVVMVIMMVMIILCSRDSRICEVHAADACLEMR